MEYYIEYYNLSVTRCNKKKYSCMEEKTLTALKSPRKR